MEKLSEYINKEDEMEDEDEGMSEDEKVLEMYNELDDDQKEKIYSMLEEMCYGKEGGEDKKDGKKMTIVIGVGKPK